jgi:hypothetical protein
MRPKLVFTGPTLSQADAQRAADVICLPPAVQGSIVAAVQHYDPTGILIVDGGFQTEPAVRHKEILWAISQGVAVIGAASMGALRAAELHPHMRGVGLVYRWYRRFAFAPDDAVAVLHGPEAVDFAALTDALVDLRRTVRAARRRRLITPDVAVRLEDAARTLNFRERTLERTLRAGLPGCGDAEREAYLSVLQAAFIRQKKHDALQAMKLLNESALVTTSLPYFRVTTAFLRDLEEAGLSI